MGNAQDIIKNWSLVILSNPRFPFPPRSAVLPLPQRRLPRHSTHNPALLKFVGGKHSWNKEREKTGEGGEESK